MGRLVVVGRSEAATRLAEAARDLGHVVVPAEGAPAELSPLAVVIDGDEADGARWAGAGALIVCARDEAQADAWLRDAVDDAVIGVPSRSLARARIRLAFCRVEAVVRASGSQAPTPSASEEQLRLVLRAARMGMWDWDVQRGHVTWSDSAGEVLGITRGAAPTIHSVLRLIHEEDRPRLTDALQRTRDQGAPLDLEHRVITQAGPRWVHTKGIAFAGENGKTVRVRGTVVDIDDRKRAELSLRDAYEELRESEERFRVVARATSDCVWDWDIDKSIVRWNDNFRRLFGYQRSVTELAFWEEAIHAEDRVRVTESLWSALELSEDHWEDEYRFRRADGTYAYVLDRGVVIRDDAGQPVRMIGAIMDLTERRELQARLALADRMASVGTLAAGVAHEINNPLAYVLANLELSTNDLRRLAPEQTQRALQALAEAREGAERVRKIVQDLKTFSRADDETRERVDLRTVVESSIDLAMNEIRHRARLVRELNEAPRVDANAGRLGQVVVNLLVNAAQAIPEGQADRNEIRVTTRTDVSGNAVLEVRDTGPGMPPDIVRRIFDPFYTTKPVGEGTGLGLTICHGIVSALGGSIEVESEVGVGSTFRVLLPRAQASDRGPASNTRSTPIPTRARVLVVDDEPMIGKSVQLLLEDMHDVVSVVSARDAIARLEEGERYDAIVCDLMMPEMTGMDLHEHLSRAHPEVARRMIFLTGGAFTARARAFLERVQNPHVEKPFDRDALTSAIATVTRRR